ncbi:hypothetical protein B0T25DRAFT_266865 [Lasiosphaeria hispida]|uniref:Uncharacterized protein n=1 Tax=Lasiosphaeria hispida TaxID=260671 RepID=A0AAJ0HAF9_9PEZI|nr:hypothetical protein B0T25DRAFT_266865 [Lasiosphaeria hispida]
MAAPAPPVLADGPFHRNNRTVAQITDATLRVVTAANKAWLTGPTYFNTKKAWHVLGYAGRPKPSIEDFCSQVGQLWDFHASPTNDFWTLHERRDLVARAYMLDALRTLGFRSPHWVAALLTLDLHPGFACEDGQLYAYFTPGPKEAIPVQRTKSSLLLAQNPAPDPSREGPLWAEVAEMWTWRKFHRYQGFTVALAPGGANKKPQLSRFRAIAVPRGPNSLWHSLAYWRSDRRSSGKIYRPGRPVQGSIMRHWQVKARIWTFFMQTLRDSSAPRWRVYHELQAQSTIRDRYYGELSLARSLHASPRQGVPAYSGKEILYVIADFFACQIVVFYAGRGKSLRPIQPADERDGAGAQGRGFDPMGYQEGERYTYERFGCYYQDETEQIRSKQIFLVTSDWKDYDPVDFDNDALWRFPGYVDLGGHGSREFERPGPRPRSDEHLKGFLCGTNDAEDFPPMLLWYDLARPARERWEDPQAPDVPPHETTKFAFAEDTSPRLTPGQDVVRHQLEFGDVISGIYQPIPGVTLDQTLYDHFQEGTDIPGDGFALPDDELRSSWEHEFEDDDGPRFNHAPENWQWRFGRDPDGSNILYLEDPVHEFLADPHLASTRTCIG